MAFNKFVPLYLLYNFKQLIFNYMADENLNNWAHRYMSAFANLCKTKPDWYRNLTDKAENIKKQLN